MTVYRTGCGQCTTTTTHVVYGFAIACAIAGIALGTLAARTHFQDHNDTERNRYALWAGLNMGLSITLAACGKFCKCMKKNCCPDRRREVERLCTGGPSAI